MLLLNRVAAGPGILSQLAVECLPAGVLVLGPDRVITGVNRQLELLFGYGREELLGRSLDSLIQGGLRAAHVVERQRFLSGSGASSAPVAHELFAVRKDGSRVPIEIRLSTVQTEGGPIVLATVTDNTERRRVGEEHQKAIDEALDFLSLVSELSARFVNLPADQVDSAINDGLRRVVEALRLDRSAVFQLSDPEHDFVLTHHYAGPDVPLPTDRVSAVEQFPWSLEKILRGEIAAFSAVDEVPDARERESARHDGVMSRVIFPISIEERVSGVIGFSTIREEREWPADLVGRLRLVTRVFGGVLARKQADAALLASDERFRTLADGAPVMIWVTGPDKACTWLNRQWLEFVGQTLDHELGDGWTTNVHPEDLDRCLQTYTTSVDERRTFTMEYRLRRHDGEWRWVFDTGRPQFGANGIFAGYIGSCVDVTEQKQAAQELERLRDRLQAENVYLRREVKDRLGAGVIVGQSEAIRRVLAQVEQVAATDATVLLLGETGTGKELFATRVHELSARHGRAMVRVNCSAIPSTLIESELFGREKGAFTGALARQVGRFELADHSTIFLDEIGDLPSDVQVKLLRVLEERQIERLGSPKPIRVDTRIIAATHRNLDQRVAAGSFREDLFYRLNVFPIQVPPLRERTEDIPLLVWRFVEEFSKAFGKRIDAIPRENMAALQQYRWPGNIRELRNIIERAMIVAQGPQLTIAIPTKAATPDNRSSSLKLTDVEKQHIRSVLEGSGWRIRGTGGAAERLGLRPTTLETRMAKLGLVRPKRA
jgi:formate hydrogenlyase transcriptional activator